ncbi:G2/mitotic-specific cyclin-A isoform X2 [Neocloeon triangulifer]|uniref:G2/mitotic-specific cyclin-A isoform X2 n=1 Tax=Neocloeon triangulifer TaxID=2078957 RepID=UPI00286EE724|nr:G2/mitotic-specific cyclin-A isoform X2 [Neocloeon triangulifer]
MSSFQIFQDQENGGAVRRAKQNAKTKTEGQKRSVLGVVNENRVRVQQPRAAKQQPVLKATDENAFARKNEAKACESKPKFEIRKEEPKKVVPEPVIEVKEEVVVEDIAAVEENVENDRESGEISNSISHLQIPDENELNLDMSMDSIIGSPMSVDRSVAQRRINYQQVEEEFYNVTEYQTEIYKYMKSAELKFRPKPGYMRKQPDITYSMRSILVDWLVEVADEYNLHGETLFLAVSYIDRFLSYMSVVRGKLQLVGTAAMFIAAKFEEIYPPDVSEFVYITDDTYTKKQVLRMEHLILKVLTFDMSTPTILRFATKYNLAAHSSEPTKHLSQYLCELSLLDGERFMHFLPSEMAAAAVALARHTMGAEPWPENLRELTGLSIEHLGSCLDPLTLAFSEAPMHPQQAIRDKYKVSKWSCVSLLGPLRPTLVSMLPKPAAETTPKKITKSSSSQ